MQCVHNFIHAALVVKTDGRVAYRLEPYFLRRWAIRSTALISSIQACSFFVSFAILLSLLMWRLRFAFQESMIFRNADVTTALHLHDNNCTILSNDATAALFPFAGVNAVCSDCDCRLFRHCPSPSITLMPSAVRVASISSFR